MRTLADRPSTESPEHSERVMFGEKRHNWMDWTWQQQNAARSLEDLLRWFPSLPTAVREGIVLTCPTVRFQITPYLLSLVEVCKRGVPLESDPIWRIYAPVKPSGGNAILVSDLGVNWERPEEMVNPILQHKYTNRINIRLQNRCLSYCMYCFEARRVLDKGSRVGSLDENYFQHCLRYLEAHPELEEVVISGGEPLTLSNAKLSGFLRRLRAVARQCTIRIQTRAFAQNPFRIDEGFVDLLREYDVAALGVHICHAAEITPDFESAVRRVTEGGGHCLLLGQTPLLKGVNDSEGTLRTLFMRLYRLGVKPYYLLHAMPETLGSQKFRTSVRRGLEIMNSLKRHVSNPALPEYVIVHATGKHSVPFEPEGTPRFRYLCDGTIRFLNWLGEWCVYQDGSDAGTNVPERSDSADSSRLDSSGCPR